MGLDAFVCCNCVRDGKAKPHPFPERLVLDECRQPSLSGDSSTDDWITHDKWLMDSCERGGFLISERLGNISLVAHIRDFLRGPQSMPGLHFPILLKKVVYDGTHSGDYVSSADSPQLLKEVEAV